MSMSAQVTAVCKSVNFILWKMSRIRKYVDFDTCNHAIRSFVLSRIDYANALLAGCPNKDITRLQRLQNKAARIIFQVTRRARPTASLLQELHWLPINERIIFKILLYVYKARNNLAPGYLINSLVQYLPTRTGLRSGDDPHRLVQPIPRRKIGECSFSVHAPQLWNTLPIDIRSAPNTNIFKQRLKTHLFSR